MNDIDAHIWDAYNGLLLGPDIERLRKLFARHELFRRTIELPGDIVECGVLKGSGLMLWLKLVQIHCPGSVKRVVGFDAFTEFPSGNSKQEVVQVSAYIQECRFDGVSPDSIIQKVKDAGMPASRCQLVSGDIAQTAEQYVKSNPGFRISLLNLDLDLERPTFAALESLWPRIVRGGIVILDEYALSQWSESAGADRFFESKDVYMQTLPWARTPTAFVIKP